MNRAPVRSIWLVLAAVSCTENTPRPGVTVDDAALALTDVPVISADRGDVVITDRGAPTDRGATLDTGTPAVDSGTPAVDSGTPAVDSGTPAVDTGTPAVDSGTPSVDTGTPAVDTGTPAVDAGTPAVDAGTPAVDAGAPAVDAGAGACEPGQVSCGPPGAPLECADLRVSTLHCGACGVRCCTATDRCVAGVCTSRCPTLQVSCPASAAVDAGCVVTRCVDVSVDDLNCGACGRVCADGTGCVSGRCL